MNPKLLQLLQNAVEAIHANNLISASKILEQAYSQEKNNTEILRLLGVVAALKCEWVAALGYINLAIEAEPRNAVCYSNRGNIFLELGRHEEALQSYDYAISLDPHYAEVYSNKGNALQRLERFEEALQSYEQALLINQNNPNTLIECARIFNLRKQYGFSIACSQRSINLNPKNVEAWLESGRTYFLVKDYKNSLVSYENALSLNPKLFDAWIAKATIHSEAKEFNLAEESFLRAYEIKPDLDFIYGQYLQSSLQMCNWKNLSSRVNFLLQGIEEGRRVALPYNAITVLDSPALICKAMKIYGEKIGAGIKRAENLIYPRKKRIRVGYFSADFHNHPTAYLMAELFECHNKENFEIIAFVFGRDQPDEMRERLVRAFDKFIDVDAKTDREIAALSREMEIDIAVDLKGYTGEGRPGIFMHGAAPNQISYLAFPGTLGLSSMDYIVADRTLIPESAQNAFVEKIIYLPNSYQVNDRSRKISESTKSRQELGLPSSGFVFCCFNNNYKIMPEVMDGWVRILFAVKGSVLWLYGDNQFSVQNLKREAQKRGLNPDRIIFAGRMDPADHLSRYKLADLFLDTTPCNAHTTASDALWAGLPVLTLIGESFAARVAASLLKAVGLPYLIVNTQEEYESLAIELAKDCVKLNDIKSRLDKNLLTAPLFDTPLFANHLELAYKQVYERYQNNLQPDHIYIT